MLAEHSRGRREADASHAYLFKIILHAYENDQRLPANVLAQLSALARKEER
jgi:hypothetical protein